MVLGVDTELVADFSNDEIRCESIHVFMVLPVVGAGPEQDQSRDVHEHD